MIKRTIDDKNEDGTIIEQQQQMPNPKKIESDIDLSQY